MWVVLFEFERNEAHPSTLRLGRRKTFTTYIPKEGTEDGVSLVAL